MKLFLAYAVSVHKYQGSQCPCIIMPVHTTHFMLLYRNLLYTGVTRGQKLVILVGTKKALSIAVKNDEVKKRYTGLYNALIGTNNLSTDMKKRKKVHFTQKKLIKSVLIPHLPIIDDLHGLDSGTFTHKAALLWLEKFPNCSLIKQATIWKGLIYLRSSNAKKSILLIIFSLTR